MHRRNSLFFSDRIDKEIQLCIQRMTLLRSGGSEKPRLMETLLNEEYKEIGADLSEAEKIFEIVLKGKYINTSDGSVQRIDIQAKAYREHEGCLLCYFLPKHQIPYGFQNTREINASLVFFTNENKFKSYQIKTSFDLILFLCTFFFPENQGNSASIKLLSEKYTRITSEKELQRKQEMERKENETEELKQSLSIYIDGLTTLDLFTGSVKQLLDTDKYKDKIQKIDCLKLISDKLGKKIFPSA